MDNQKTPEEKPNELLCQKTVSNLSLDLPGFEYAIRWLNTCFTWSKAWWDQSTSNHNPAQSFLEDLVQSSAFPLWLEKRSSWLSSLRNRQLQSVGNAKNRLAVSHFHFLKKILTTVVALQLKLRDRLGGFFLGSLIGYTSIVPFW